MVSIVVYYQDKKAEVLKSGVSLEKAKQFCNHPDTHGKGWFCGFNSNDNMSHSSVSDTALSAKLHRIYNNLREV
jgi:hypothetical protein